MSVKDIIQELADDVKEEIIARLHSPIGVNPRTGTNTLIGSNLEKSINVYAASDNELVFEIADYYEYIVTGWRRTGRFPHTTSQFLKNIMSWVHRKDIRIGNLTDTEIVWHLYNRMLVDGREIAPRPFINYDEDGDVSKILPFLDEFFNNWADRVFQMLMEQTDKYFN